MLPLGLWVAATTIQGETGLGLQQQVFVVYISRCCQILLNIFRYRQILLVMVIYFDNITIDKICIHSVPFRSMLLIV